MPAAHPWRRVGFLPPVDYLFAPVGVVAGVTVIVAFGFIWASTASRSWTA